LIISQLLSKKKQLCKSLPNVQIFANKYAFHSAQKGSQAELCWITLKTEFSPEEISQAQVSKPWGFILEVKYCSSRRA